MIHVVAVAKAALDAPPFVVQLLEAAAAMVFKDALATNLVVAESRGRDHLAGLLDAGGDLASAASIVFGGAGSALVNGFDLHTFALLAVTCVTSYCGTRFWTRRARRMAAAT